MEIFTVVPTEDHLRDRIIAFQRYPLLSLLYRSRFFIFLYTEDRKKWRNTLRTFHRQPGEQQIPDIALCADGL